MSLKTEQQASPITFYAPKPKVSHLGPRKNKKKYNFVTFEVKPLSNLDES